MLGRDEFRCPGCKTTHATTSWDNTTQNLCANRTERRKYVGIQKGGQRLWYRCPGCGKNFYKGDILVSTHQPMVVAE